MYGTGRNDFDAGNIHYKVHWKWWAQKIETFWGPKVITSETHLHKITNVHVFDTALGLNDFDEGKTSHWT
jgi:hypothetical protein